VLIDWHTAPIKAQLRAMLGLLEKVTLDPDHVIPDDVQAVLTTGVSKQAIEDALRICACFNIISRLADAFDVAIPSAEGFTQTGIQLIKRGYA
jgi:alkylhydroperoxidase family enzyme